jgi:hypothetical protein
MHEDNEKDAAQDSSQDPARDTSKDLVDSTAKEPSKASMMKMAIPLIVALAALLIYNFQSIHTYQDMTQDIHSNMFADPNVEALLLTYRENAGLVELTINVKGIEGDFAAYRNEVLKFVCTSPSLESPLSNSDSIAVKLTSDRRKEDKYLTVNVSSEVCLGMRIN